MKKENKEKLVKEQEKKPSLFKSKEGKDLKKEKLPKTDKDLKDAEGIRKELGELKRLLTLPEVARDERLSRSYVKRINAISPVSEAFDTYALSGDDEDAENLTRARACACVH